MNRTGLLAILIVAVGLHGGLAPVTAAEENTEEDRPFVLPFKEAPGPDTWLLGQTYGNTVIAYGLRDTMYQAGQGIHFGVDFITPCGAELVAMADGVVSSVDEARFGSLPHNLMIDHPDLGYASFYGHLLERPALEPGQTVTAGQFVALSGDPAETCYGRPHLHLEIRDLGHWQKYNPVTLIQADWDNLSLVGPFYPGFERDLDSPRKWQHLDDQPDVIVGGALLNDFARPWPPDRLGGAESPSLPVEVPANPATPEPMIASTTAPGLMPSSPFLHRITTGGCCTQPFWSPESDAVLFIDEPAAGSSAAILSVPWPSENGEPNLLTTRIAWYTEDLSLLTEAVHGATYIERSGLILGNEGDQLRNERVRWSVPASGRQISISPGQVNILWTVSDNKLPFERRTTQVWVADLYGKNARLVASLPRGGFIAWISDDELLLVGNESFDSQEQVVYSLSLSDDTLSKIAQVKGIRNPLLSPGGDWLVYFVVSQEDTEQNGLWVMRSDGTQRQRLDESLFGSYAWRSSDHLLVIPFEAGASSHAFWEVDVNTLESRQVTDPDRESLKIANGDWTPSPDGQFVMFVESRDRNIWVLELPD